MENKNKPFRITIETLDRMYIDEGKAPEKRVIECEGYFLHTDFNIMTVDSEESKKCDGISTCQGHINKLALMEGVLKIDDDMKDATTAAIILGMGGRA